MERPRNNSTASSSRDSSFDEMNGTLKRNNPKYSQYLRLLYRSVRAMSPPLTGYSVKGDAGILAIIGGSTENPEAVYYAAITALRCGVDLVHVICPAAAAASIQRLSPDLIVHPILDAFAADGDDAASKTRALQRISTLLETIDMAVIGPGLAPHDVAVLDRIVELFGVCRHQQIPLVVDGEALRLVSEMPQLVRDYHAGFVLTPNGREMCTLAGQTQMTTMSAMMTTGGTLVQLFGELNRDFAVLEKGHIDFVWIPRFKSVLAFDCLSGGSNRRCWGQGHMLCGAVGAFFLWALTFERADKTVIRKACVAASYVVRQCNERAYAKKGRGIGLDDMVSEITLVIAELMGD